MRVRCASVHGIAMMRMDHACFPGEWLLRPAHPIVAVNDAARARLVLSSVPQRVVRRRAFKLCAGVDRLGTLGGILNRGRTQPAGVTHSPDSRDGGKPEKWSSG